MNPGLPEEKQLRDFWEAYILGRGDATDVFGRVYRSNFWGLDESSGDGSRLEEAQPLIDMMSSLKEIGGWQSIVDLGCGSGLVASHLGFDQVDAVDVYSPHLERRRRLNPQIRWHQLDIDRDRDLLPSGDVALLKDVLHHWPSSTIDNWLSWAISCNKWKWLILAQDRQQQKDGEDCILGGYRALDYRLSPLKSHPVRPLMLWVHKQALLVQCHHSPRVEQLEQVRRLDANHTLGVCSYDNGLPTGDQAGRAD